MRKAQPLPSCAAVSEMGSRRSLELLTGFSVILSEQQQTPAGDTPVLHTLHAPLQAQSRRPGPSPGGRAAAGLSSEK